VVNLLYRLTEPVFAPVRRVLPPMGGLDLAPLVVLLIINFIIVPILV
jgi:YggT family protein